MADYREPETQELTPSMGSVLSINEAKRKAEEAVRGVRVCDTEKQIDVNVQLRNTCIHLYKYCEALEAKVKELEGILYDI